MIPPIAGVVAIVGRPNVGKSTLFNRLCKSREALVHDRAGLTRDRKYGTANAIPDARVTLIDTGGLHDDGEMATHVDEQVQLAIDESDVVVFVVNARDGITTQDLEIAAELRRTGTNVLLTVNKIDGLPLGHEYAQSEFAPLGFSESFPVSASNGHGMNSLVEAIENRLSVCEPLTALDESSISVAVIGRPNVGKSTLVNALVEDERCIVYDEPGTTRDVVRVQVTKGEAAFEFFDTAGIRRKGRVNDVIEKFSIVKALDALQSSEVALLVIDALEGVVEQDLHLMQFALEAGSGLVLVVNKWDTLKSADARERCRNELSRRTRFAEWIQIRFVSALDRRGTDDLFDDILRIHDTGKFELSTNELTQVLLDLTEAHPPPQVRGRTIKLRYAHKIGSHPPSVMVHGNQTESLHARYKRYLENGFRRTLGLSGWPVVIKLRSSKNPFEGQKNVLTERQKRHRDRLIRHRKTR